MDWQTWSPFQSVRTQEICAHLTAPERAAVTRRASLYGIWVAITFAIPLSSGLLFAINTGGGHLLLFLAALLVIVHIVCIPIWLRSQRLFFSNTAWAREQGITPQSLSLFGLSRK
ncbi:MAG: hypothetical protein M3O30_10160 [Planctomycetota bacterium]|nr:hypothetical protein [Planctomycetota bacterium]